MLLNWFNSIDQQHPWDAFYRITLKLQKLKLKPNTREKSSPLKVKQLPNLFHQVTDTWILGKYKETPRSYKNITKTTVYSTCPIRLPSRVSQRYHFKTDTWYPDNTKVFTDPKREDDFYIKLIGLFFSACNSIFSLSSSTPLKRIEKKSELWSN